MFSVLGALVLPDNADAMTVTTMSRQTVALGSGVSMTSLNLYLNGFPEHVYTLGVDLHSATLNVVAANDRINSTGETIMSMASRTGAIGGINGDVFDLTSNRAPYGGEVINSSIVKTPLPGTPDQFFVTSTGTAGIGSVTFTGVLTYRHGAIVKGKKVSVLRTQAYSSINNVAAAANGALAVLTSALGPSPLPPNCIVTLLLMTSRGMQVTGTGAAGSAIGQLAPNRRVLLGCKAAGTWLRSAFPVGTMVLNSATIRPAGAPASVRLAMLQGGPRVLVAHGQPYADRWSHFITYGRNPESWVCVDNTGTKVQLGALDGRIWGSSGLTLADFTSYLVKEGCYTGLVLDGGGSTALVGAVDGPVQVLDEPATGSWNLRPLANALFVYPRR